MLMRSRSRRAPRRTRYRAGDLVRLKSAAEIAATLDEDGTCDRLPFMPEMMQFCGKTFTVRSSAHKTCDSVTGTGLRSMRAAVHLDGLRCDGAAHGGCQSGCPLFWKDEWLAPADELETPATEERATASDELRRKAWRSLTLRGRDPDRGTYSCQATELLEATAPLPFHSPGQYWDDVRSGNVTLGRVLRSLPLMLINKYQRLSTRLPRRLRIRDGRLYPNVTGRLSQTPDIRTGIQAGELVEIRSHDEILATLDTEGRNRGLGFDADMVGYCGQPRIVQRRLEVRIDERTGRLVRMRNPCLVLDGVVCDGHHHRFCPRGVDQYWREAWLRRQDPDPPSP
jgi:hypothetical protein